MQAADRHVTQRELALLRADDAGATDREHAAEPHVRQRDLGAAARERELDAQRSGAAVEADRAGDHADAAGIRHQLDALGGDVADAVDVGLEAAGVDHDPAHARAALAPLAGACLCQLLDDAREVRIAGRVDVQLDPRAADVDLVGAELAR